MTLKVVLSTKHSLFTNFPVTCEDRDLPGNFSNQLITGGPLPEMAMFGGGTSTQPLHLLVFMATMAEHSFNCCIDDVIRDKIRTLGRVIL
ncbi:Hypothetical predicted protein, partial [Lynx pardinus]